MRRIRWTAVRAVAAIGAAILVVTGVVYAGSEEFRKGYSATVELSNVPEGMACPMDMMMAWRNHPAQMAAAEDGEGYTCPLQMGMGMVPASAGACPSTTGSEMTDTQGCGEAKGTCGGAAQTTAGAGGCGLAAQVACEAKCADDASVTPELGIVARLSETPSLRTFVLALRLADLTDLLDSEQEITIFAPTEEAFAQMDSEMFQVLLQDSRRLREMMMHHIVPAQLSADDARQAGVQQSVAGYPLELVALDGGEALTVGGARILQGDISARNGVIHIIDRVLTPQFPAPPRPVTVAEATVEASPTE